MSKDTILESFYIGGEKQKIFVPIYLSVVTRLGRTHLRNPREERAGNFLPERKTLRQLIEAFRDELVEEAISLIGGKEFGTHSVELVSVDVIGWSSTIQSECLPENVKVKWFEPNWRSTAMRVALEDTMLAPLTKQVTFIFELVDHDRGPMMIVRSVYPGPDVGELEGNITEREGVVFFDFNHPGLPYV